MANKTIFQLGPAPGALALTTEMETQVAGGGASQKAPLSKVVTLVSAEATSLSKKVNCVLGLTVNGAVILLNADGSAGFAGNVTTIAVGGNIEVADNTKGLILWSPSNTRFRIVVSDLGVLSTVPA